MNKNSTSTQYGTDWERLRNMKDEDIDYSDIPPITPEMFANAVVRKNFKVIPRKSQVILKIDEDVIEFFKNQSQNYQTKINELLRAYVEAHRTK